MSEHPGSRSTEWDAARYDMVADPQTRWGSAVLERLELTGDERVLDAGCGSGRVTEQLLERLGDGRVVALDASASMLQAARRRLARFDDRVRFVHQDLLDLDPSGLGADSPLDAVFSTATFHWVTDHDRLFANLSAVLGPGGQLVAQCGAEGNIERVVEAVGALGIERAGTWLYASQEATAERLERAGFVDVQTWTHEEPTRFSSDESLSEFLETVCLREHLATFGPSERRALAEQVAAALPGRTIDYIRLNIVARRAHR